MSLFVWYFGTNRQLRRRRRTTRSCWAALPRAARRHLRAARCSPRTSASTCTARRRPIRRSRRRAATPSTCSRRCRTSRAAWTGATRGASRIGGDRGIARGDAAARPRGRRSSPRGCMTPPDFQDRLLSVHGAAFGSSPCSRRARGSGRTTAARTSRTSTSSARARIPARACPGCSRRARVLDTVVPDAADARLSRTRRRLRADRRRLRGAAPRRARSTFHVASRLLPARVRDPAVALYAFCRLADDAVDDGRRLGGARVAATALSPIAYDGRPRADIRSIARFAGSSRAFEIPARAARGAARGHRLGCERAALRDLRRPRGLRRARGRHASAR